MKRLILIVLMMAILAPCLMAATTTWLTPYDSLLSYSKAQIKFRWSATADTADIFKIYLYWRLGTSGAWTKSDSVYGTALDSARAFFTLKTGLRNATTYEYFLLWGDSSNVDDDTLTLDTTWMGGPVVHFTDVASATLIAEPHNKYSITTTTYTPTISEMDSTTYTRFVIGVFFDTASMGTAKPTRYVAQYADSGSTMVSHKGDTATTLTFSYYYFGLDTLIYPGHKYAVRLLTKFRDGAAGDTLVDTSATIYVTIPDLTPIVTITQNGDSLAIAIDTADCGLVGATINKIVIQRNLSKGIVTSRWTRQDSTANPDTTINYNDIRAGVPFTVRAILACSLSQTEKFTDTSAVYTYNIADPLTFSMPLSYGLQGCFVINKTSDAHSTGYIPIPSGVSQFKLRWKMSGYATPGFADSVRFFVGSLGFDGRKIIDTLIDKTVVDTSADSCKAWPIWGFGVNDSTYKAANPINQFSSYLTLWDSITDSATAAYADSELNQYKIYWQIEWNKQ